MRVLGSLALISAWAGCGGSAADTGGTEESSSSRGADGSTVTAEETSGAQESSGGSTSTGGDDAATSTSTSSGTSSTSSSTSSGATSEQGTSSTTGSGTTGTTADTGDDSGSSSESGGTPEEFALSSTAFENIEGCGPAEGEREVCALFPPAHVNTNIGGDNLSPPLSWTEPPAGTASFAIVFHDLSNGFAHWVMWNIPADPRELPEGLPGGAMPPGLGPDTRQVDAPFAGEANDDAFFGSGRAGNVYEFALYALDIEVFTPANAGDPDAVQDELEASAALLGSARLRARSNPSP